MWGGEEMILPIFPMAVHQASFTALLLSDCGKLSRKGHLALSSSEAPGEAEAGHCCERLAGVCFGPVARAPAGVQ